jgi:2-methylcitrate dehydratase PrpD
MLQRAGALMTTAALRSRAEEPVSPVMAKLSAYMSEAASRALPDDILEKTKHHILDTFAAMISGAQLGPGEVAIRFARAHVGERLRP